MEVSGRAMGGCTEQARRLAQREPRDGPSIFTGLLSENIAEPKLDVRPTLMRLLPNM